MGMTRRTDSWCVAGSDRHAITKRHNDASRSDAIGIATRPGSRLALDGGWPVDVDGLRDLARPYGLSIIEDCARRTERRRAVGRAALPSLPEMVERRRDNALPVSLRLRDVAALWLRLRHRRTSAMPTTAGMRLCAVTCCARAGTVTGVVAAVRAEGVSCSTGCHGEVYREAAVPMQWRPAVPLPPTRSSRSCRSRQWHSGFRRVTSQGWCRTRRRICHRTRQRSLPIAVAVPVILGWLGTTGVNCGWTPRSSQRASWRRAVRVVSECPQGSRSRICARSTGGADT